MKITMHAVGIQSKIVVLVPDTYVDKKQIIGITKEEAEKMAIERVCMIKQNDVYVENNVYVEEVVGTYTMYYKCCNCGSTFSKKVPLGQRALGAGGKCPHCGIADYSDYSSGENDSHTHKVLGMETCL